MKKELQAVPMFISIEPKIDIPIVEINVVLFGRIEDPTFSYTSSPSGKTAYHTPYKPEATVEEMSLFSYLPLGGSEHLVLERMDPTMKSTLDKYLASLDLSEFDEQYNEFIHKENAI